MHPRQILPSFALTTLISAIGCAAPSEEVGANESAVEGVGLDQPEVGQRAEERWRKNEAIKAVGARSVVAFQIDEGPIAFLEEDRQELVAPSVPSATGSTFQLRSATSAPVTFRFDRSFSLDHVATGLFFCAPGKMVVKIEGEEMESDPRLCVLDFHKSFDETLPPGFAAGPPSKLHVGSITTPVVGASGAKHYFRLGFVVAEPRR